MGRRNDHSRDELRQMIVDAAEGIIMDEGYTGLSMRKVAKAIGYTVGTLYLVFRNQDALLFELNARTQDKLYNELLTSLSKHKKPIDRLQAMARCYIQFAHENRSRWLTAFEHRPPTDIETPPWLTERIQRSFMLAITELKPALPKASDAELQKAAGALWSGVHGICVLALTNKLDSSGVDEPEALAEYLVAVMVKGLK